MRLLGLSLPHRYNFTGFQILWSVFGFSCCRLSDVTILHQIFKFKCFD